PGKPSFVACVWGEQVSCQGFWVCSDLGKVTESTEVRQESDGRTLVLPCRSLQNTTGICPGSYSLWEQGGGPEALQAVPGFAPEGIHLLFHSSSYGERAERVSAEVPPPEAQGRNPHEGEQEQEAGNRIREKKKQRHENHEHIEKND